MTQTELQDAKTYFSTELLAWYRLQKRDLPWRQNQDPYRIWVSEIMLQQTRVDTVIPYYQAFMAQFPTVQALAEAPEEEVLKRWEGLGYYSRARNLQAGAKMVMEQYGGVIPDSHEAVSGLRGVGPYTSGAIMSIAFNRPYPAVDGNVMRVLSRYFCLDDDIAKPATRVGIEKLAVTLIPEGAAGDFNQALMELGALVCTPKSPGCLTCPVMEHCAGRIAGKETVLPIKTKAKPPRDEYRVVAIVEQEGKVLVRQRPRTGLLAQMWELPHVLLPDTAKAMFAADAPKKQPYMAEALVRETEEASGLFIRPQEWVMDAEHVFSHIHWRLRVFGADLGLIGFPGSMDSRGGGGDIAAESLSAYTTSTTTSTMTESVEPTFAGQDGMTYRWIGKADMEKLPFPNVFIRILGQYWGV
ncbi:A/G-specific adenine glycosylase [Paenibacillus sp. PAMC21692]|uniref:A/G-specific adenine glycosylase n=1 Tax=Paenibacillus sp. PAMC21692 TaxID=2762320 RepID=UPI00164CDFB8|nr:A/G-specific adenine glycosylase [Paenibacillus sp. PAMC21692]QNK56245.1 A/G-specific adenine glycosylase [Paenibacillus sp. PAMC21692]